MKLEGFGLFVRDIENMVCFYNKVLNFNIEYKPESNNVYLKKDGVLFLMYPRKLFEEMVATKFLYPKGNNGTFEISLQVENYQAVDDRFEDVVAKGAKIVLAPTTTPWGQRTCYISDPEGNLIEISSFEVADFKEKMSEE